MSMAKSTYYFEFNRKDVVAERNQELLEEIKSIFEENKRRYGVRRVHQELVNRGYNINHKRVQRLMHEAGLSGKRPKQKYLSLPGDPTGTPDEVSICPAWATTPRHQVPLTHLGYLPGDSHEPT